MGGHKDLEEDKKLELCEELRQLGPLWVLFHLIHSSEWVSLAVLVASLKGVMMSLAEDPSSTEPGALLATLRSSGQQTICTRLFPVPAAALAQDLIRALERPGVEVE